MVLRAEIFQARPKHDGKKVMDFYPFVLGLIWFFSGVAIALATRIPK
jgi:hypothetical protein